jgi:undecaprenyl-phosphate 4-deoxy-4-formamido-L-arabinose transferase
MHISFIIPCYGSEKTIEFVVTELIAKMSEKPDIDYEIIAVNDCSPDAVWSVLNHLSEQHDCLKLIDLAKNMNRPGAVMAGLRMSSGDIAVIMDDDGQCPVSELWQLLEPLQHDFDVSMAKYPQRKQTWFKSFGTWVNRKMTEFIIKKPKNLEFTNFMAIKRYVVDEMIRYDNPYPYLTGLLLRTTKHITNVEMEQRSRYTGASSFTFLKMFSLWSNGLTAFSVRPLRVASVLGFFFAMAGFLYGIWKIILKLLHPSIPVGYSSIVVFILIIGGIIMMMLGLIGEYIGRIYISLNHSPQYVIRKTVGFTKNP